CESCHLECAPRGCCRRTRGSRREQRSHRAAHARFAHPRDRARTHRGRRRTRRERRSHRARDALGRRLAVSKTRSDLIVLAVAFFGAWILLNTLVWAYGASPREVG